MKLDFQKTIVMLEEGEGNGVCTIGGIFCRGVKFYCRQQSKWDIQRGVSPEKSRALITLYTTNLLLSKIHKKIFSFVRIDQIVNINLYLKAKNHLLKQKIQWIRIQTELVLVFSTKV